MFDSADIQAVDVGHARYAEVTNRQLASTEERWREVDGVFVDEPGRDEGALEGRTALDVEAADASLKQ